MKPYLSCALAACLASLLSLPAGATQVYTWTDENGVVHFVDQPPDNPAAVSQEVQEAYRPGSADAYPAKPQDSDAAPASAPGIAAPGDAEVPLSAADQKRAELAEKRAARREQQAERDAACALARQQVATLEPHRRVFFTNDQGETERLDDEVRVKQVEEAKAAVEKYCD